MTTPRYSRLSIALHWTMAVAIATAWVLSQVMDGVARGPMRTTLTGTHALMGLAVLALLPPRVLARLMPPPGDAAGAAPGPAGPHWEERLAQAVHLALYALMLLLPLTGLLLAMSGRRPLPVLGLFEIPNSFASWNIHRDIEDVHEVLANLMLGLVTLHVLATLCHALVRHDDVAARMIPLLARHGR